MIDYNMKPFRFWCQKVLPLVYDDSLSYMELLCKVINYLNKVIEDINGIPDYINQLISDEKLKEIMSELLDELREQIARANEGTNTTASYDRDKDELVWLDGKLVRMTRDILAGDRYVEDAGTEDVTGNFVYTSVELEMNRIKTSLSTAVTQLQTNIDNEAQAREDADTQLQTNIDNEAQARLDSDNLIKELIKEKIIINVKDYGAEGDGTTDDTLAIETAIEKAGEGGTIYFPLGNYKTTNINYDNIRLIMAPNTVITDNNETTESKYIARPYANSFNQTVGELSKMTCDIITPPRSAECLVSHDVVGDVIESVVTTGSIANGSNIITVLDSSKIKIGDGVLCGASGWISGDTTQNTVRVIDINDNEVTVGIDNGEGAGVGDTTWTWTGDSISNVAFTFRHRSWTCAMFLGNTTANDTNVDRINWGLNVVGVSHGEQVIVQEIDNIAQTKRSDGGYQTGLLVTGQNNCNENMIGIHITMGGLVDGGIGLEVAKHVIGAKLSALTSLIVTNTFYNNGSGNTELVAGNIVSEDYGDYLSIRPNIAMKQITNGAVMQSFKRVTDDNPSGFYFKALTADGSGQIAGLDVLGNASVQIMNSIRYNLAQAPVAKTITCTHTIEFTDITTNTVYEIPCAVKQ